MRTFLAFFACLAAGLMAPAAATAPTPASAPAANSAVASQSSDPAAAARRGGEAPSDASVAGSAAAARTSSVIGVGQPDGRWGLQDQFTPIGQEAAWFHDIILMPLIAAISLFVLGLLLWVIVRYRRAAHPVPSRTSHNTALEIAWTLIPVIILVVIAIPSIDLLQDQYSPPRADVTVKVIGNQWYWEYEYPDHGVSLVSNMLPDEQARANGEPRQLAVDERLVVPAGATVKLIVTSNDVIHAWGIPAFWTKIDAVPGRMNETWFRADRPGVYYGVCYELCGVRHGYMPIAVEVVPPAQFAAWIGSRGGAMPGAGARPAAAPGAGARPNVAAGEGTAATPAPTPSAGAATPATTRQGATQNQEGGNPR